jgi:TPR repeat protein
MLKDEWSQSLLGWHFVWKGKTFEAQQEGVQWLRCAARQGHKPAMYRLSEALRDGRGADVDEKEALYWLQLGADLGNCDCQCALGVCYLNGGIVEKDFDKAHQWFQIASLQGEGWPWYLLGISYEDGLGVTKDYEAAVRCFKEGAELGDPRSIFKVGMASNYGTAQHAMGFLPGLKAFTAAVFGGIGNLAGAVIGGILLGLIEAIGSGYIGYLTGGVLGSHYTDIFAFIVLIIVLTLRPSGLMGERVADRA